MNTLIIISVLPILLLYLGLYKAQKALLPVTVIGLLIALGCAIAQWNTNAVTIYHDMMLFDNFSIAFSTITILSNILIKFLSRGYIEKISSLVAVYYLTLLFIGIEIMAVSLYILAGIKKSDFSSNVAALKYFLMGAFSTGFLLFGITLLYGSSGSFSLEAISNWVLDHPHANDITPMFYTGVLLIIVGLCFKVGAAPFHFWTPDVYEGSPTLITAIISTLVKTT